MRKLLMSTAIAGSVVLGGCTTLNQGTATFLGQVQAFAAQACHFIPDIATIVGLYNAGIGTSVGAIGTAICALVPPPATLKYKLLPRMNVGPPASVGSIGGIVINGWRTQ